MFEMFTSNAGSQLFMITHTQATRAKKRAVCISKCCAWLLRCFFSMRTTIWHLLAYVCSSKSSWVGAVERRTMLLFVYELSLCERNFMFSYCQTRVVSSYSVARTQLVSSLKVLVINCNEMCHIYTH